MWAADGWELWIGIALFRCSGGVAQQGNGSVVTLPALPWHLTLVRFKERNSRGQTHCSSVRSGPKQASGCHCTCSVVLRFRCASLGWSLWHRRAYLQFDVLFPVGKKRGEYFSKATAMPTGARYLELGIEGFKAHENS